MAENIDSANNPVASKGVQGDGTELKGQFDSPGTHVPLDRTPHKLEETLPEKK